jgi:hypothetical protein
VPFQVHPFRLRSVLLRHGRLPVNL